MIKLTLKERFEYWEQMESFDILDFPIGELTEQESHEILDRLGVPKMKEKKPDIVVWDETRGYYASKLPYGSNVGAPSIKTDDVEGWKVSGIIKANKYFESKFNSLKKEYEKLVDEVSWSNMIYRAKYSFEPTIGSSYHLYIDTHGNPFLSLIGPNEWKNSPQYVGEFKLDHQNCWEKI